MRFDLQVLASWVEPGSKVLDLGCGRGELLAHLMAARNVTGTGIEMDEAKAAQAMAGGAAVIQGDINEEILDYPDKAFDYAILSQTLQQVYEPLALIREILRVAVKGVVSFPNFGHWRVRKSLLRTGRAPVTRELPYAWYDTPNIRVITLKDFDAMCRENGFTILKQGAIGTFHREESGRMVSWWPNLRAAYGVYLLGTSSNPGK